MIINEFSVGYCVWVVMSEMKYNGVPGSDLQVGLVVVEFEINKLSAKNSKQLISSLKVETVPSSQFEVGRLGAVRRYHFP